MKNFLFACILLVTTQISGNIAWGSEYHILDVNYIDMEFYKINNHRDADFPYKDSINSNLGEYWANGYSTRFNLDLVKINDFKLYFNNHVHGESTNIQVRQVGWEYEVGVDVAKTVDLFWHHHSQHLLDVGNPNNKYPLDNFYGIRLIFLDKNAHTSSGG